MADLHDFMPEVHVLHRARAPLFCPRSPCSKLLCNPICKTLAMWLIVVCNELIDVRIRKAQL
eukprot:823755-Amphidinium_carterae.1